MDRLKELTGKLINLIFLRKPVFMVSLLIVLSVPAFSQTHYKLITNSQIKVSGTSSMHNWVMKAANFECDGDFVMKDDVLQDISSLSFALPVTNLKSKKKLMDTRTYTTLKAKTYKNITFKLSDATVSKPKKTITATGDLNISGVTNRVTIQASYILNNDNSLTFTGSKLIKMSDYGIKAPSFMMGTLTTGNEVTIDITLKFIESIEISKGN